MKTKEIHIIRNVLYPIYAELHRSKEDEKLYEHMLQFISEIYYDLENCKVEYDRNHKVYKITSNEQMPEPENEL